MLRLKPDLYRNFAIGFALGAGIVALQMQPDVSGDPIPQAMAAELDRAPQNGVEGAR